VIDPGIDVGLRIAEPDNTGSGGEGGIPSGGFLVAAGPRKPLHHPLQSGVDQRVLFK
jgi:hypothetical protein